jgi:cytoskeletal protein RodZ
MEWLNNLTGGENGSAINLLIITLAIFLLVIIIGWIFRKLSGSAAKKAMRSRVPRLSITDTTKIDEKRWLVMVRRDNIEHLILIGGSNDVVVETNIVRAKVPQNPAVAAQTQTQAVAPTKDIMPQEEAKTTGVKDAVAKPEQESSLAAPVAGVAALGAAGLSSVKAAASNVTETVTGTVTDNASKATDSVTSVVSATADAVSETASDATSAVGDTISKGAEAITETASNTVETVSEAVQTETSDVSEAAKEVADIELESQISAQLDDALSVEELQIDTAELSDTLADEAQPANNEDDEMQRLLDELSSEMKEPA